MALCCLLAIGPPAPAQTSSAYADAVLADTPVGYWRLGETTGTKSTAYGYLDEVAVYARVLPATRVQAHYDAGCC